MFEAGKQSHNDLVHLDSHDVWPEAKKMISSQIPILYAFVVFESSDVYTATMPPPSVFSPWIWKMWHVAVFRLLLSNTLWVSTT